MNKMMNSASLPRLSLAAAIVLIAAATWLHPPVTKADKATIVVYKTPTCGCCVKWVEHLRDHGLEVHAVDVPSTIPAHERFGVPRRLASCHTAVVGEYWVEGHVPADLVQKLLSDKPHDLAGIAVPGMPIGSPGMEGPNPVEYQVLAYSKDEKISVFATRQGKTSGN